MERNGNKVLLTVIGIAVLIVATIGATFAYFSASGGTAKQSVTTGELKVAATSSLVDGKTIKPTTWESATAADADTDIAKVGLDVVTDGTTITTGKYDIYLTTTGISADDLDTTKTGGSLKDVKWALYDDANTATAIKTGDFESGNYTNQVINDAQIQIPAGTNTDNYTLYIWIEDTTNAAQDQLQGLTIDATLKVDARQ